MQVLFPVVYLVPYGDPQIPSSTSEVPENQRSSSSHPLLGPLSGAASVAAFLSYNTRNVGTLSWMFFVGFAIIGVWGFWTVTSFVYCGGECSWTNQCYPVLDCLWRFISDVQKHWS